MSRLLVRSSEPDSDGRVIHITPESAGWGYVGFEVFKLKEGQSIARKTGDREYCLVLVSGFADITAGSEAFADLGTRASPFDGKPADAVYVPAGSDFSVTARTDLELGVGSGPARRASHPARVIRIDPTTVEVRGKGTSSRYITNILPDSDPGADSLLVVEVITPAGHWSSYPPHKHDRDALPAESALEETYYHRLNPPQGFAFQRVYTDDRSIDETISVQDGDVVMVPKGYHPVGAPHGYDLYYLNVMAGPTRKWVFKNDPDHDWIVA